VVYIGFYGVFLGVSRWKLEENEFLEQNPPWFFNHHYGAGLYTVTQ